MLAMLSAPSIELGEAGKSLLVWDPACGTCHHCQLGYRAPAPLTTIPGAALVCSPFPNTLVPFTHTSLIPTDS